MTPLSSREETLTPRDAIDTATVQPERLFRAIFQQAAVGIALIETTTGRFLRVNQRYCEIVGLAQDDMTATTFMAITHPDDLQTDLNNMEELKAGRIRDFHMEKRYFRPDGSIVWVELTVSPMWERGMQPTFHIAVVQDMTERKLAQASLRLIEGQLAEVLKNSTEMVFMKDSEGRYLLVNHAFERQFGLNAGQVLGKTDRDIFPASQADLFQAHDQEVMQSGMLMEFEEVARYADGEHISIVIKFPLRNAEGSIYAICGIVTDITERKQAEQKLAYLNVTLEQQVAQRTRELEASRQQLQAILDGTSDAVFIKDTQGRYLLLNEATARFVGRREGEVIGRDDRFLFSPTDAQAVMEADRKVMTGGETMTYEDVATTADGVQRTFLSTKGPLFDGQGCVTGLFGIARDITERKRAEQALRESEERFRNVFEHAGTGIAITDLDGRFLRGNPAYCALLGYTEAELREMRFTQVVHPADLGANLVEVNRLCAQEVPSFEIENRFRHKDGHDVWVHKFVSQLRDDSGQPTAMFTLVTDITERRRMHDVLEQRVAERTEALRISEAFNKEVLDSLSAHVVVLDATGIIVAVNRVWEEAVLANDPSGLAQVSVGANYVNVCERAANTSSEAKRIWQGLRDVLEGRTKVFETEYPCVWPGHQLWFSMRVTPLRDRGGCVIVHDNITERKRSEEALRDTHVLLHNIINAIPDLIFVKDHALRTVLCNTACAQAQGKSPGELIGHTDIDNGWDPELVRGNVEKGIRGFEQDDRDALSGQVVHNPHDPANVNGEVRIFDTVKVPLRDATGRITGVLGVARDATERKQVEDALRDSYQRLQVLSREVQVAKEQERSRLARELHDEFGQVLSGLKFDLIGIASAFGKKRAGSVDVVRTRVMRALEMVDRLFGSLRGMVSALRPALLDELGLIAALESLAADIQERFGLRCDVVADRVTVMACCGIEVESAIYRMTQELLNNVVRHAKATTVRVTICGIGGWVRLTVGDDGQGFDTRHVRKPNQFGLRGIRERAELLGGQVTIDSKLRVGTVVTIQVPLELSAPCQEPVVPVQRPKSATTRKRRRRGH